MRPRADADIARLRRPGRPRRPGGRRHSHDGTVGGGQKAALPVPISTKTIRCTSSFVDSFRIRRSRPQARQRPQQPGRAGTFTRGLGSGFIFVTRRLRDDERARGGRRRRDHGHIAGQTRVQGQAAWRGQAQRRRAAEDRGDGSARGPGRGFEQASRRRRIAVRSREHRDGGHRQRQGPRDRRVPAVHPDRRGRQPGQLGRPADQHARRGGRHQRRSSRPPAPLPASRSPSRSTKR